MTQQRSSSSPTDCADDGGASPSGLAGGWSLFKKRGGNLVDKLAGSVKEVARSPLLRQALEARQRGNLAASFHLLEEAFDPQSEDLEVATAFWDVAVEYEHSAEAVSAVRTLIRHYAHASEGELATQYWGELVGQLPDALAEPSSLIRIVPLLQEQWAGEEDEKERGRRRTVMVRALRAIVNPENTGMSPGLAVRTAELAREIDPDTALRAARLALLAKDLDQTKRKKLQHLVARLEPNSPAPEPGVEPARESEVAVLDPPQATSSCIARFPDVKAVSGRAIELSEHGVWIEVEGGRRTQVEYVKIEALAVGRIGDLSPTPVAVIDLVLNWNSDGGVPLRVVRLRADELDAPGLAPDETSVEGAFGAVLSRILSQSRPVPLPDPDAVLTGHPPSFATLAEYERAVLEVSR